MSKKSPLTSYLVFSAVAAAFLGVIFFAGSHDTTLALVAAGVTFIVTVVVIATLDLSVKNKD